MIEQIRDLLKAIESSDSQNQKTVYSLKLCELVFENTTLDKETYQNLETEDMILDSVLSMDEIVKYSSNFLEHSLEYLEADLKGSDFELEIQANLKLLQDLHSKHISSSKKYKELNDSKEEVIKVQSEINELQSKIDEFTQVDLEKMKLEKEQMAQRLVELEETEGDNLKIYKRHLEENENINIYSPKVSSLSKSIYQDLKELDETLLEILQGKGAIK